MVQDLARRSEQDTISDANSEPVWFMMRSSMHSGAPSSLTELEMDHDARRRKISLGNIPSIAADYTVRRVQGNSGRSPDTEERRQL